MSTTSNARGAGRPRKLPQTKRGKAILAELDKRGLTLHAAAEKARVSYDALHRVIHEPDPDWLQVRTIVAVCENLGLSLELVAPSMARLAKLPESLTTTT